MLLWYPAEWETTISHRVLSVKRIIHACQLVPGNTEEWGLGPVQTTRAERNTVQYVYWNRHNKQAEGCDMKPGQALSEVCQVSRRWRDHNGNN